jgi:hypothetical protein
MNELLKNSGVTHDKMTQEEAFKILDVKVQD